MDDPAIDDAGSTPDTGSVEDTGSGSEQTAPEETPQQTSAPNDGTGTQARQDPYDPNRLPTPQQWKQFVNDHRTAQGRLKAESARASQTDEQTRIQARAWAEARTSIPGFEDILEGYLSGDAAMAQQGIARLMQRFGGGQQPQAAPGNGQAQGAGSRYPDLMKTPTAKWNQTFQDVVRQLIREEVQPHLGSLFNEVGRTRTETELAQMLRDGYDDLPKYKDEILAVLAKDRQGILGGLKGAYHYVKGMKGAYGTPKPKPDMAGAFTEGSGGRQPANAASEAEEYKRAIMNAGHVGGLGG